MFVVLTYFIFLVLFITIGLSILSDVPEWVTNILQIIAAWSSTFAFIILFKKIYPELSFIQFVKQQFAPRLRLSVLITIIIIQALIIATTLFLLSDTHDLAFTSLSLMSLAFLDHLIRGPLGEELGWRGYALNELQRRYSPLNSALIIVVLWGFWHAPLWFASGYTSEELIKYIVFFMIGIISFSIIVTLFYNLNKNLLIPIVIHQLFNFSLVLIKGDLLDTLVYVMLSYFFVAIILIAINPKEILYKKK